MVKVWVTGSRSVHLVFLKVTHSVSFHCLIFLTASCGSALPLKSLRTNTLWLGSHYLFTHRRFMMSTEWKRQMNFYGHFWFFCMELYSTFIFERHHVRLDYNNNKTWFVLQVQSHELKLKACGPNLVHQTQSLFSPTTGLNKYSINIEDPNKNIVLS